MSILLSKLWNRNVVFCASAVLRFGLIIYGEWQDSNMVVKYTDVDYQVYTDAARFVWFGESPFRRATFRYTPFLAFILTPNIFFHVAFGKILFSILDLLVALMTEMLLAMRGVSADKIVGMLAFWLFNPFVFTVSTRGNADVLMAALVLGMMAPYWLITRYGLSVHLKIYPIYFVIALLLHFNDDYISFNECSSSNELCPIDIHPYKDISIWRRLGFNRTRIVFGLVSGGVFIVLGALACYLYGFEFVYETYLYHLVRKDNRHNFSVYFYHLYLRFEATSSSVTAVFAFFPQVLLMLAFAIRFSADLPYCLFLQTLAFVAFNKVITAQYFIWWLSLVPLVVPHTTMSLKRGILLVAMFFAGELHWLFWAFQLEFRGSNVFLELFGAGIAFFIINIAIIYQFLGCYNMDGL